MKRRLLRCLSVCACVCGALAGASIALAGDAQPVTGGGVCAIQSGCRSSLSYSDCVRCCGTNCSQSTKQRTQCDTTCYNWFCRFSPGAAGCTGLSSEVTRD